MGLLKRVIVVCFSAVGALNIHNVIQSLAMVPALAPLAGCCRGFAVRCGTAVPRCAGAESPECFFRSPTGVDRAASCLGGFSTVGSTLCVGCFRRCEAPAVHLSKWGCSRAGSRTGQSIQNPPRTVHP